MLFQEIPGLLEAKAQIIRNINAGNIAHAQLFYGSEGGLALPMALAYITYLYCENKQESDACGKCPACIKCNKLIHPDFSLIFPAINTEKVSKATSRDFLPEFRAAVLGNPYLELKDWIDTLDPDSNKQANISVEESRNILSVLSFKASESVYKTILIWLPEYMNIQAANALLKILEEPPSNAIFILVSNDHQKLLPTIISRLQMMQIEGLDEKEIEEYLIQQKQQEPAKARQIAYLVGNNLNRAIALTQDLLHDPAELIHEWLRICYKMDFAKLMEKAEVFAKLSKDGQKNLMLYGIRIFRDALFLKQDVKELVKLNGEEFNFAQRFSSVIHLQNTGYLYQLLNEAYFHLERNANPKIVFLDTSLQLASRLKK